MRIESSFEESWFRIVWISDRLSTLFVSVRLARAIPSDVSSVMLREISPASSAAFVFSSSHFLRMSFHSSTLSRETPGMNVSESVLETMSSSVVAHTESSPVLLCSAEYPVIVANRLSLSAETWFAISVRERLSVVVVCGR